MSGRRNPEQVPRHLPAGSKKRRRDGISGTLGRLLKGGHFTFFHYSNSDYTVPWGVNWQDDIVGRYEDQEGTTHRFILTLPLGSQTWQQINEPKREGLDDGS
jgi:hypothetical protein